MQKWWLLADWTKTNKQLAQEFGKSYNTVAKKRVKLGFSGFAKNRETRCDKGVSKAQPHLNKPEYQKIATEAAKISPKAGRFETNVKAKTWTFKSPENKTYTFTNLMHFVRTHEHLFEPEDVVWRKKASGVEWCRASSGLAGLAAKKKTPNSWKGWKLISVTKR